MTRIKHVTSNRKQSIVFIFSFSEIKINGHVL